MLRRSFYIYGTAGALLFLVQVACQPGIRGIYASGDTPIVRDALYKALSNPGFVALGAGYLLVGTLVHALLLAAPVAAVSDLGRRFGLAPRRIARWRVVAVALFLLTLCLLNKSLFPASNAVPLLFVPEHSAALLILAGAFACVFIAWLVFAASNRCRAVVAVSGLFLFLPGFVPTHALAAGRAGQPNVIFIGIDSLRPDHLPAAGSRQPSLMPHLSHWLNHAVVYDDAVTPMARTFPALMSLLTAKYPAHTGIRGNLFPRSAIHFDWTFAKQLQQLGYKTAFAIDATRFANIVGRYGFDMLSTPPQGLGDFVYGDSVDTVGTNLLGFFPAAAWLNPIEYANRAAAASYRPAQFDDRLTALVQSVPATSSFVMVHLCIAHWPYVADSPWMRPIPDTLDFDSYPPYARGLMAADGQFASLMHALRARSMLDNAIVAVYSDHGEELGIDKDRAFRRAHDLAANRQGHGTSIFSPSQSRILLSLQKFEAGTPVYRARISHRPALLTDIATTVLPQLPAAPPLPDDLDGIDLLAATGSGQDRVRFLESGYTIPQTGMKNLEPTRLVKRFGGRFHVTDSLKLVFNAGSVEGCMKQRGALRHGRVVGLPRSLDAAGHCAAPRRWRRVRWPNPRSRTGRPGDDLALKAGVRRYFSLFGAAGYRGTAQR